MKKICNTLLCILVALTLTGCSSSDSANSSDSYNSYNKAEQDYDDGYADEEMKEYDSGAATPDTTIDVNKKLIKTAEVIIEANDVTDVYATILAFAKENGGYEFSQTSNSYEASKTIEVTIKIKPESLDSLIHFAGTKGDIVASRIDSEDITDSYYDSKIRLDSLNNQLEKYNGFLENTKNVEEMLRVQTEIDRLITEIEVLEGRLSKWDKLVAESTVHFTISQKVDPSLTRREIHWNALSFGDMGYLIRSGFVSIVNIIVSVVQWLAIILLVTSPLWAIPTIVLCIVFRQKIAAFRKRRKEKKLLKKQKS